MRVANQTSPDILQIPCGANVVVLAGSAAHRDENRMEDYLLYRIIFQRSLGDCV